MLLLNKVTVVSSSQGQQELRVNVPWVQDPILKVKNGFPQSLLYCHSASLPFPFDEAKQSYRILSSGMENLKLI